MIRVLSVILFIIMLSTSIHVDVKTPITPTPPKPIPLEKVQEVQQEAQLKQDIFPLEALINDPPTYASLALDLPMSMSYYDRPTYHRPDPMISSSLITDIGDVVLLPPELVLDLVVETFDALFGVSGPPNSITAKIFDFHVGSTRSHLFSIFIENMLKREMRYFGGFGDSYLNTPSFMDGTTAIEESNLLTDQRKILWDVGKNTYLSKYRIKVDGIRDEAFHFSDWRGIDFAMLPPLVASYLYYRGFEKKVSFLDTEARIYLEPLQRWIGRDDLLVGIGLEWAPKDWPVKLLIAAGVDDGDVNVQFIGIGTSIGMVKKLLFTQSDDGLR